MRLALVAAVVALLGPNVGAQEPKAYAEKYLRQTLTLVDTCIADLDLIDLGLQLYRLRPSDPSALSPQAAAKRLDECAKAALGQAKRDFAEQIEPRTNQLAPPCLSAVDDFYASVVAHYETFAGDPTEVLPAMMRRIKTEARQLRTKATRTRLTCERS